MKSIMQNEKACYLTGYTGSLHKHHIYGGNGRRHICEAHGFWCYLRPDLHNLSNQGVHFNHELDLQLKQECPYSGLCPLLQQPRSGHTSAFLNRRTPYSGFAAVAAGSGASRTEMNLCASYLAAMPLEQPPEAATFTGIILT